MLVEAYHINKFLEELHYVNQCCRQCIAVTTLYFQELHFVDVYKNNILFTDNCTHNIILANFC